MEEATNPDAEVETDEAAESAEATRLRDEQGRFARAEGEDPEADAPAGPFAEAEETDEIDLDGEKLALPKSKAQKLREAMMRQADYTRKTQEVAEQRRQVETAMQTVKQTEQEFHAEFEERAAVHALKQYLGQYEAMDWGKATDEDPVAAQKQFMEWQALKGQLAERQQNLQKKQEERTLQAQRETARRAEDGHAVLHREIKNWSPDLERALKAYAVGQGISNAAEDDFRLIPNHAKILHKAYLWDEMSKKAQAKPQPPAPKPVRTVGQASKASGDRLDDDLPIEEWHRRWQAKQRN